MGKNSQENDVISILTEDPSPHPQSNLTHINDTIATIVEKIPKIKDKKIKQSIHENRSRKWSMAETAIFYQLLEVFGTDFTMMSHHCPGR